MKVLKVASVIPMPAKEGGRAALHSTVRSVRKEGEEVRFVAPRVKAYDADRFSSEATLHLVDYDPRSTLPGRIRNLFSSLPYSAERYYSSVALRQIAEVVRKQMQEALEEDLTRFEKSRFVAGFDAHIRPVVRNG